MTHCWWPFQLRLFFYIFVKALYIHVWCNTNVIEPWIFFCILFFLKLVRLFLQLFYQLKLVQCLVMKLCWRVRCICMPCRKCTGCILYFPNFHKCKIFLVIRIFDYIFILCFVTVWNIMRFILHHFLFWSHHSTKAQEFKKMTFYWLIHPAPVCALHSFAFDIFNS